MFRLFEVVLDRLPEVSLLLKMKSESGHRHCVIADPRLESALEADEDALDDLLGEITYSERMKRFPIFGRVVGVRWLWRRYDPDNRLKHRVIEALDKSSELEKALMAADIDLELELWSDEWVVCDPLRHELTRPIRDCFQAIAKALLEVPLPFEDRSPSPPPAG